jgi:outer membrane protein OmpA-like peptidoglycan-associated protein
MKQGLTAVLLAACIEVPFFPVHSDAQEVRYLNERATKEDIINVLAPRPTPGSRGLKPVPPALTNPQCKKYRAGGSRGLKMLQPAADIAAFHVRFEYNSANLTPDATHTLDTLAEALKSKELAPCCMRIEGHTDGKGSDQYNLRLSEKRAQSVVHYLAAHYGLDAERLMAVGYGKNKPIESNDTEEGRQKNRRVQFATLGYGQEGGQ